MFLQVRRATIATFLLIAIISISVISVSAQPSSPNPASIRFDLVQITQCENDIVEGRLDLSVRDQAGNIVDVSGTSDLALRFSTSGAVSLFSVSASAGITSVTFGVDLPGLNTGQAEVTASLTADPSVQSPVLRINCGTLGYEIITGDGPGSGDGRLNPNAGDLLNVLYAGTDKSGKPVIDVYKVDGERGVYFDEFEYALFEPYLNAPPASNTRLASVDKATLYALASGEFQINIGPDAEGKYGVVIFRGLPPTAARRGILELR